MVRNLSMLLLLGICLPANAADDKTTHDADWMHAAKWGVLTHYLGAPPSSDGGAELTAEAWNKQVDAFDVPGLVDQLASTGTKYIVMTLGQNSGHYCSPNATYDKLVGISPSKCSRRDLVADLYKALEPRGIRLMVYLPSGAPGRRPGRPKKAQVALGTQGRLATAGRADRWSAGRVPADVGVGDPRVVAPLGNARQRLVDRRLLLRRRDVPLRR